MFKNKACMYLRLSKDDGINSESNSIINQRELIQSYAKNNEIELVKEYVDDGYSGTTYDRPALKDLMEEIGKKNRAFDIIIVKDLSRFGRDYIGAGTYIQKIFPQLHIRFISINDNYDSKNADMSDTNLILPIRNFIKNISHSGKVSNDFSLFRRFCCINRCFRCSCGKFSIVHGEQAAIGFPAAATGEKRDLPETHPVQLRTESRRPFRSTRAKPASKGLGRALSV